jgi:actin related protein 2/3 complex subunit 1A/1B
MEVGAYIRTGQVYIKYNAPRMPSRHRTSCLDVVAAIVDFSEEPRRPCPRRAASSRPTKTPRASNHLTAHLIAVVESLLLHTHITMGAPEVNHLFHHPIADHSFSADRQTLAVARENNVDLYARQGSGFKLQDELTGHDKTVTGVDIAPNSGKIVTCSQGETGALLVVHQAANQNTDRNAYVWEPSPQGWKPTLVLLRINRAATCVRWAPSETKFAVGSGARLIPVCYFEEEDNWWVSKHIKKPIRSTVTCVAWHPNSVLLAAGSTDGHARVISSFVKGVDERPEASAWGERLPFNTVCGEFLNNTAGWVHSAAFSPSGNALAFASHDSTVTVVYPGGADQPPNAIVSLSTQVLPFMSLLWSTESEIIAAGYNCEAFRLQGSEQGWQLAGSLESKGRPGLTEAREESALNMFRQMDLKGKSGGTDDTKLKTVHQNTINTIRSFEESGGNVTKISSTGVDGRVVIWTL